MIQLLVMVVCVWSWVLPLSVWAGGSQEEEAPLTEPLSRITVPPGIPLTEAFEVLKRHQDTLMQLPGVTSVGMGIDGIIVETDNPAVLPVEVEGVPIKPVPPPAQEPAVFSSEPDSEGTLPALQDQTGPPPEQQCGPYAHWEPAVGRCRRDALPPDSPLPPPVHYLPPPPGVIILWPDGTREQADSCPGGVEEIVRGNGWRLCLPQGYSEPIPPLWAPPIAGSGGARSASFKIIMGKGNGRWMGMDISVLAGAASTNV